MKCNLRVMAAMLLVVLGTSVVKAQDNVEVSVGADIVSSYI